MSVDHISISIYLLKTTRVADFRSAVLENQAAAIPLAGDLQGQFLPIVSPTREPVWVDSVRRLVSDPAELRLLAQNAGGLMVVERNGRTFVATFGHAWQRLKDEWLEHDFGRRVALSAIPKNKLLEVNAEQVFAKWHLARERAPKAAAFKEFGVESERDLVSAIEGIPDDASLGPVLRGGTSVRVKIPLKTLGSVLDRIAALYRSNKHKKQWPELQNLTPVSDDDLVRRLDENLDADLTAGRGAARVVLVAPSLRKEAYQPAESYVFGRLTRSAPTSPYLMFGSWEAELARNRKSPSVQAARTTPVRLLDGARDEIATHTVYDCLGYETSLDGRQYILSSGVWYEAGANFVASINKKVNALPRPRVALPPWDGKCTEGEYNASCANSNKALLHFDAKMVPFGGEASKFEFCDLAHPKSRTLYFAKIPTRSSDLSHLTEQTRRTVELLFSPDGSFREALKAKMATTHPRVKTKWLDSRPRPGNWNLCLVSLGRAADKLPFFAKCGLARLIRELEERGHCVSYLAV